MTLSKRGRWTRFVVGEGSRPIDKPSNPGLCPDCDTIKSRRQSQLESELRSLHLEQTGRLEEDDSVQMREVNENETYVRIRQDVSSRQGFEADKVSCGTSSRSEL